MINEVIDIVNQAWPPTMERSELPTLENPKELSKVSEATGVHVRELAFYFLECWRND